MEGFDVFITELKNFDSENIIDFIDLIERHSSEIYKLFDDSDKKHLFKLITFYNNLINCIILKLRNENLVFNDEIEINYDLIDEKIKSCYISNDLNIGLSNNFYYYKVFTIKLIYFMKKETTPKVVKLNPIKSKIDNHFLFNWGFELTPLIKTLFPLDIITGLLGIYTNYNRFNFLYNKYKK